MNIAVIGINHNLSSISIREKVSFTDTKKIEAINILLDGGIDDVVILSTCNRSEIYISCEDLEKGIEVVRNFYEDFFKLDNIKGYLFSKKNEEAINHLFIVTSGLDSVVLGEDQILGQVKDSYEFSMKLGATKKLLNKLFREAITTAKEVKTITKISQQPLSISYIGIKLLKEKIGSLMDKNILIIGLGKMNMLTIKHLQEEVVGTLYVVNRSVEKFKEIQSKYSNIEYVEYKDRYNILIDNEIDIVISATSAPHLVIRREDMPSINNHIYFMDLALPRDIDFKINELEHAKVYCIDDLKEIQHRNDDMRINLSKEAYEIINEKIKEFIIWQDISNIDPTIQSLNNKCTEIKYDTLDYIFRKIDLSQREKKIIDKMLASALKRVIREPIINLKQVKNKGKREEYIKIIEELFDI
ncbi:glutamyl-tRNA reductase [Terrisporobacter vanillatitrophus]|uniref:glutamyl-tRNA reductase n=1 Tax=Terrisporobacter vanillatitrophus TaxID=3058402 RepID=UPI003369B94A